MNRRQRGASMIPRAKRSMSSGRGASSGSGVGIGWAVAWHARPQGAGELGGDLFRAALRGERGGHIVGQEVHHFAGGLQVVVVVVVRPHLLLQVVLWRSASPSSRCPSKRRPDTGAARRNGGLFYLAAESVEAAGNPMRTPAHDAGKQGGGLGKAMVTRSGRR